MKLSGIFIVLMALSLAVLSGCQKAANPVGNSGVPFLVYADKVQDSVGYCSQRIIPPSNSVNCGETLHAVDTAGASVVFQSDTLDYVGFTPGGTSMYVQSINIDSTDCASSGCKYWVNGIQVDTIFKWSGIGYVCSFNGQPRIILTPFKTTSVAFGYTGDTVQINYRDTISTPHGSTRNNILQIQHSGLAMSTIAVTSLSMPSGFTVVCAGTMLPIVGNNYKAGQSFIQIEIASSVQSGNYLLQLDVKIDGEDYGSVPCTMRIE